MEKREHQRLLLNIESLFFIENDSLTEKEFSGQIDDISESGISIRLEKEANKEVIKVLEVGTEFTFSTFDILSYNEKEDFKYISGVAKIVRIEELENNIFVYGCRIVKPDKEIVKYLDEKRANNYLKRLQALNKFHRE